MRSVLSLGVFTLVSQLLLAQTSPPRISVVHPAGGKAGTTVEVSISGADFDGAEALHFDFPGATVEILGTEAIVPDAKKGVPVKKTMGAPSTTLRAKITLPADVAPGTHDLRVVGKNGISNPRAFVVGTLEEIMEKEPNDDVPLANKIPLNVTVNGAIGTVVDVDYFQFTGKKGERVVVSCITTGIESRLQAALEIYSSSGKLLASNRNYQNNDAVTDVILPEEGDYYIRVFGFTHTAGGADYNYRLTVGTMPWIDAVVPAAVEPGKETKVEVIGRNLPGGVIDPKLQLDGRPLERATATVKAPGDAAAIQNLAASTLSLPPRASLNGVDFRLSNPSGPSNAYFLAFAKNPVAVESEPNDRAEMANALTLPVQVSGRIDRRDTDWYRFTAKKGVPLAIELFADRLNPSLFGSAVDLKFVVLGPDGKILTVQDDNAEVPSNQFFARHEDPARFRFTPTADEEYKVGVSAADELSSPRAVYSLRIAPDDGDFRVVAMPVSPLLPDAATSGPGGGYALHLFVSRLGNFTGDVMVQGKKLPPGVTVPPQVISANQKQAAAVLLVADNAPPYTGPIELEAIATIDGKKVARDVRSATITFPVQLPTQPTVSRINRELALAIRDKAKFAVVPTKNLIVVRQGEKVTTAVKLQALDPDFRTTVQVTGVGLPTGMLLQPTPLTAEKETPLSFDSKTPTPPGRYTLILRGQTQPPTPKAPVKGAPPNIMEHSAPISLVILPKQAIDLTPPATAIMLMKGKEIEAKFQVSNPFPIDGPIEISLAANTRGVSMAPVTLKGNETEVTLKFQSDEKGLPGTANLTLRATGRAYDVEVTSDSKVSISVK